MKSDMTNFIHFLNFLNMIESDVYMYFENKKLKKTDKLSAHFKKMILIEYKDYYYYY